MGTLNRAQDKAGNVLPGVYSFICDCGYDKRQVSDAEKHFSCERPIEAKVPRCTKIHTLDTLLAALEDRERKDAARKVLAESDRKIAEAKAILGIKEEPVTITVTGNPADFTTASASAAVTTIVPSEPAKKARKKKES